MTEAALSHEQARNTYRWMTTAVELVGIYEDIATRKLLPYARLDQAEQVFEFGCGTGRFAEQLLRDALPAGARYTAIDVTPDMVARTQRRLSEYADRVDITQSDGDAPTKQPTAAYDRFLSNYVFDLLPESEIVAVLDQAHRMLRPGGLLCVSSMAPAHGPLSRLCVGLWTAIYRVSPALVGGCRPIQMAPLLDPQKWRIIHQEVVTPLGLPLEILAAERLEPPQSSPA